MMLLKFPTCVDAHLYSIGTRLDPNTGEPHQNEVMACQKISNGFPEDARALCELDGMVGAHDVSGLLTREAAEKGAVCVRASNPFYDASINPSHCWMAINQVQLTGNLDVPVRQENLFSSSFVINTRLWERHAPDLVAGLQYLPFEGPETVIEGQAGCRVIEKIRIEPDSTPELSLEELPQGVGLIMGALASGFPGQFGRESFTSIDEFLFALQHTLRLLPAALRHTVSFAYGFAHRQPICALQYFDDREIVTGAFSKPMAAAPIGAEPEMTAQAVRGLLAERLKNAYAPTMHLNELEEFEDDDELFEEEGLFDELTGLARETCASLGQILNEIGIQVRADESAMREGMVTENAALIAFDCLLKGEDRTPHIAGLYNLFSDFDSAPTMYQQLLADIDTHFIDQILPLSKELGTAIRDETFDVEHEGFLDRIEDLLCLSGRLPVSEPFLEYRSRIIEGAADALRQYMANTPYLTPMQLVALSEYEQVSDMVACILETGDWAFTQRLNISFTIFALSGDGYVQDAAALARRLLPPSVISHQWIHALINSRALAEAFEALIQYPDLLPGEQVITILKAMTEHLARTGRKETVVEHVTRLSKTLPHSQEINFSSSDIQMPLEAGTLLRLQMMTILSDAAERFHASAQHARLILSR